MIDTLLFGADTTQRIVGLDCDSSASKVHCYTRLNDQAVREQVSGCQPFLYLHSAELPQEAGFQCDLVELAGDDGFRFLARFTSCAEYTAAVKSLAAHYRLHKNSFAQQPYYEVKEFTHQHMTACGTTHYLGLELDDLRVLHLALQLSVPAELADPADKEQRIAALGLLMGEELLVLSGAQLSEKELLERFVQAVQAFDPDIICGHSLFKFILSFLAGRAARQRVKLKLGRGGRAAETERYTMPLAERRLEFPRMRVFARSLVDTWILAQGYDIFKREMDSYELSYVAQYLRGSRSQAEAGDLEAALTETAEVFRTLIPHYFYLAQMLPYSLEDCIIKGNATKINSLLLREYYRARAAVPYPAEGRMFPGGYTDVRATGVIRPVINVDVASLYPSLILQHRLFPSTDRLGVFETVLRALLERRFKIKQQLKELKDAREFARLDALQGTFKTVINSFYGYLGTSRMNFADLDAAAKVTELGQQTVKHMASVVEELGARIVEIDTDGIYLQPPENCRSEEGYAEFVALVNQRMPGGVSVELEGVYEAMLSYKVKNYALLAPGGKVIIKGSGLKSRGLEPFLRRFIEESIRLILTGRAAEVERLYASTLKQLTEGAVPVRDLAKTEILVDSLSSYQKKLATTRRNPQAQYEVALKAARRCQPGDPVSYYITGNSAKVKAYETARLLSEFQPENPDVNIPYYQKRLAETYQRVRGFAGTD